MSFYVNDKDEIISMDTPIHDWFGLTYANWLTIPRIIMQSMPVKWQEEMVLLLKEMDAEFDWLPETGHYQVSFKDQDGKFAPLPEEIEHYRRGTAEHLRHRNTMK